MVDDVLDATDGEKRSPDDVDRPAGASDLGIVLAGLTGGAGVIHLAMAPQHAGAGSWIDPVGFALVGWAQVLLALVFVSRRGTRTAAIVAAGLNAAAIVALVWARTVGLPFGSHAGVVEEVGVVDGVCAALEALAVCVALVLAASPERRRSTSPVAGLVAVTALAVATFGLVAPGGHDQAAHGADSHAHGGGDAGGHTHGAGDEAHAEEMSSIDRRRCDLGFNPTAYWSEAAAMGVDTYGGGTMAMEADSGAPSTGRGPAGADPSGGRGSVGLDRLVAATSQAATGGEMDAADVVVELAAASDADRDAWRSWMRRQAASGSGHSHGAATTTTTAAPPTIPPPQVTAAPKVMVEPDALGVPEVSALPLVPPISVAGPGASEPIRTRDATVTVDASASAAGPGAAPDDNGGHGGHVGPQPWTAMVDQDQCIRLADELAEARKVALSMPTAADAMAAGYTRVTPYVPGIAAHYMKYSEVDGAFHVDRPEMVLYDGDGPDAHVVGLSYYLIHPGESEPTQGFTGDEDHYHRHVGLCMGRGGLVIGDTTTSAEDCAARGGHKAGGSGGWMSHAWVVPGCESPWGVFSGANPILDTALASSSGGAGGCAGSGARTAYDLSPGSRAARSPAATSKGRP